MDGRKHVTTVDEPFTMGDGRAVRIRRIREDDAERLQSFYSRLSEHSQRMRFFVPMKRLRRKLADRLSTVDFVERGAFVVSEGDSDEIHGVGRYERVTPDTAEVAFAIEDSYQGAGLGRELLHHLATHAQTLGVTQFSAVTLVENREMIELFARSGYPMVVRMDPPLDYITLTLDKPQEPTA